MIGYFLFIASRGGMVMLIVGDAPETVAYADPASQAVILTAMYATCSSTRIRQPHGFWSMHSG